MAYLSMPWSSSFSSKEHKLIPSSSDLSSWNAKFAKNVPTISCKINLQSKKKSFQCDECNAFCKSPSAMTIHKRKHTSFTQSNSLKIHKRTHTGNRPYCCDECNASFTRSDSLKIHKRIHTGERPFHCDGCDASFAAVYYLNVHKKKHARVCHHICDMCNSSFSRFCYLKQHKQAYRKTLITVICLTTLSL